MGHERVAGTLWVGTRLSRAEKALLVEAAEAEERSVAWLLRRILVAWLDEQAASDSLIQGVPAGRSTRRARKSQEQGYGVRASR